MKKFKFLTNNGYAYLVDGDCPVKLKNSATLQYLYHLSDDDLKSELEAYINSRWWSGKVAPATKTLTATITLKVNESLEEPAIWNDIHQILDDENIDGVTVESICWNKDGDPFKSR